MIGTQRNFDNHTWAVAAHNLKGAEMKQKFTEYERRQIQAMMRKQMPWRKNLVLGSDCMIKWDCAGEKLDMRFDPYGISAEAFKRWQAIAYLKFGENITENARFNLRKTMGKQVDHWRYNANLQKIVVSDCLKGEQICIENTQPYGFQIMDLLDTLETEFRLTAENMGELTHIVGGWSPNAWNNRSWGERYNRMKALWRKTAEIIGQFEMARKGYAIFKEHGFDGRFVGFTEK